MRCDAGAIDCSGRDIENDAWGVSEESPRGAPRATVVVSVFVE